MIWILTLMQQKFPVKASRLALFFLLATTLLLPLTPAQPTLQNLEVLERDIEHPTCTLPPALKLLTRRHQEFPRSKEA